MFRRLSLTLMLTLAAAGCGAEAQDVADNEVDVQTSVKSDHLNPRPFGTFLLKDSTAGAGAFDGLVLNLDGTFTRTTIITCITTPCDPIQESGTFRFTRSLQTGRTYIRFYVNGLFLDRYEYMYDCSLLPLRKVNSTAWFVMQRQPAGERCGDTTCPVGMVCCNPLLLRFEIVS